MGLSERDGRTLANVAQCLLKDGGFPQFLWGEILFTAAYINNSVPHTARRQKTPYRRLVGQEANLRHLRANGARAFVNVQTHTKKLDAKAWEEKFCAYRKASRTYSADKQNMKESRNVTFIEAPSE